MIHRERVTARQLITERAAPACLKRYLGTVRQMKIRIRMLPFVCWSGEPKDLEQMNLKFDDLC